MSWMVSWMGREEVEVERCRAAKERPMVPAPMRVICRGLGRSIGAVKVGMYKDRLSTNGAVE